MLQDCFIISPDDDLTLPLIDWAEVVFQLSDWLVKLPLCSPAPVRGTTVKVSYIKSVLSVTLETRAY